MNQLTPAQTEEVDQAIAALEEIERDSLALTRIYRKALAALEATDQEAEEILTSIETELQGLAADLDAAERELLQVTTSAAA